MKKKSSGSVKTRLMVTVGLIMAVPLIISIIISYATSHAEAVETMNELNSRQVALVEHDFNAVVMQNMRVLQAVATAVSTREALQGKLDEEQTAAVQRWLLATDEEIGDGNALVIVGADGMQIIKSKGDCVDVSEREYFKYARDKGKFYVSDQNISKTTGARICTFITPVFDEGGSFIGAVQRNYNLAPLTQMVIDEVSAKNQDIFIGDNNGDLIAHTTMDLEAGEPVNFSSQQWYTASRSDLEANGSYSSKYNGGNWKMAYQREPITGWVTVIASDVDVALADSYRMLAIVVIVGIIMLIIALAITWVMANSFTRPIEAVNDTITKLAKGEFVKLDDPAMITRKDEFGDIVKHINSLVDKLKEVVQNIKSASGIVTGQAKELSETSDQINSTTNDVSAAVQEIAKGATEQAGSVEKASENLNILSDAIRTVAFQSEQLAAAAAEMNDGSQSSAQALKQLTKNMDSMESSVAEITQAMNATNEAVQNVNEKVDGITSIASQTNLLALNASIEAARAGEAGRGFAVVAEEIGKLATESADTAKEIRQEMINLLEQSRNAIGKTDEVAIIGKEVSQVLADTVNQINSLISGVNSTVDGVTTISGLAEECDASKTVIVDAMNTLSAVSEENAASTEETSASMQELNATINLLANSSRNLDDVAEQLNDDLSFFKL